MEIPQLLTVKEVARALQVSQVWIYKLAREGRIPFYHISKALRFDPEEIQAWLQSKKGLQWHRDKRVNAGQLSMEST